MSMVTITSTATAVVSDHCQLRDKILPIAHTASTGALMMTCKPMETIICTCCTSLVERVISDAVEKPLISAMEKLSTLSKTLLRIRKESADAMRAAKKPTATELSALPSAQPSMSAPFFQISPPCVMPDTASWVIFAV